MNIGLNHKKVILRVHREQRTKPKEHSPAISESSVRDFLRYAIGENNLIAVLTFLFLLVSKCVFRVF
jgi:hypothetical protein